MHPTITRIAERTEFGDCWIWTGATDRKYGTIWHETRMHRVHRIAWQLLVGPIPKGLVIHHQCINEPCWNPDHLMVTTQRDNTRRSEAMSQYLDRGNVRTHCKRGHEYDGTNSRGHRTCTQCDRINRQRRQTNG